MMSKILSVALAVFLIIGAFSGCSGKVSEQEIMPDIVFFCVKDRTQLWKLDGENRITITFCSNEGKFYCLEDDDICTENTLFDLITKYSSGELEKNIELVATVEVEEVKANYELLKRAAANKNIDIISPEIGPDVLRPVLWWYGVVLAKNSEIQIVDLHLTNRMGSCYSNDDNANQIYEWYESIVSVGEEPY